MVVQRYEDNLRKGRSKNDRRMNPNWGIGMILEYRMRLKEIEERIEGNLKPLWGKLRTVDDIRFLLDLVKMQQAEIERLKGRKSSGQDPLEVHR